MLFNEKTIFLESEKSFLKVDIAIQQKVIDGIFEYNSNLLIMNVVEYRKILTIESSKE